MVLRGNWGGADNTHGNAPNYLPIFNLMIDMDEGRPSGIGRGASERHPEWFDGKALSAEGKAVLEKLRKLIPCLFSQRTFPAGK